MEKRPRRMRVGEGASSIALACQALYTPGRPDQGRIKQAIAVRAMAQRVVHPPVVGRKRPATAARNTLGAYVAALAIGMSGGGGSSADSRSTAEYGLSTPDAKTLAGMQDSVISSRRSNPADARATH